MKKIFYTVVAVTGFTCFSSFFCGCSSSGSVSGGVKKEHIELIKNTATAYVFYHSANTVNSDGSYEYQTDGREIIKRILNKKGYNVEFVGKYRQGTLFIELVQSEGETTYTYKTDQTVGTYKDRYGNVVGTYNQPVTKYRYKHWTRVDIYLCDPSNTYDNKLLYQKGFVRKDLNYNLRCQFSLTSALSVIPSRKK